MDWFKGKLKPESQTYIKNIQWEHLWCPADFFLLKPIHWKSKGTAPMVHRWPYLMAWWPFMALPKLPVSNVTGKSTFTEWNLEWEIIYLYIYIYVIYIYIYIYYIIYIYINVYIDVYYMHIYINYIYICNGWFHKINRVSFNGWFSIIRYVWPASMANLNMLNSVQWDPLKLVVFPVIVGRSLQILQKVSRKVPGKSNHSNPICSMVLEYLPTFTQEMAQSSR